MQGMASCDMVTLWVSHRDLSIHILQFLWCILISLWPKNKKLGLGLVTVCVDVDSGSTGQEQLHDLERPGLSAIVQCRVPLDGLAVDVGLLLHQVLGDLVVTLVAGDHQAGVPVSVGDLNVWKAFGSLR